MAGRKPRESRDEQSGVTPLHGPRGGHKNPGTGRTSGIQPDGTWVPAYRGQRRPFAEGNDAAVTHGATSPAKIKPRAEAIINSVLEDPLMPGHLRSPAFRYALQAWAEAEAASSLLYDWIAEQSIETLVFPRLGATRAPIELWQTMAKTAATLRGKLGLDPASYSKISKNLGLEKKAAEDGLTLLATAGAAIVAARAEITAG